MKSLDSSQSRDFFPPREMLKRALCQRESIPVLERLVESEREAYSALAAARKSGRLDFGKRLSGPEIRELHEDVAPLVHEFLRLSPVAKPAYIGPFGLVPRSPGQALELCVTALPAAGALGHFTGAFVAESPMLYAAAGAACLLNGIVAFHGLSNPRYLLSRKEIMMRGRSAAVPSMLAHEYAHFIQDGLGNIRDNRAFAEGHARGVERYAAKQYAARTGNPAAMYFTTAVSLIELESAYDLVCRSVGVQPRLQRSRLLLADRWRWGGQRWASNYVVGHGLFRVRAEAAGEGIYAEALRNPSVILETLECAGNLPT